MNNLGENKLCGCHNNQGEIHTQEFHYFLSLVFNIYEMKTSTVGNKSCFVPRSSDLGMFMVWHLENEVNINSTHHYGYIK